MTTEGWASLSRITFTTALLAYVVAMVGYFYYLVFRKQPVWVAARTIAYAGLAAHVVSVVSRGISAGRVPWGNMYEYSSLLSLLVVAAALIYIEGINKLRTLPGFALAFAVLT